MNFIFNVLRYIALLVVVYFLSGYFASQTWDLYSYLSGDTGSGTWIDARGLVGLSFNIFFLLPAFFVLFGERYRYWVLAFLVPSFFFLLSDHFGYQLDIVVWSAGFLLGFLLRKLFEKTTLFERYKQYF